MGRVKGDLSLSSSIRLFFVLSLVFGFAGFSFLLGCASTVSKIIPLGEPVTKQSCEKLDVYALGLKDGEDAKREGERFEFWRSDCAAMQVPLNRVTYKQGYRDGMAKYCSCEKGYLAGRNDELKGFQGQYYACGKEEYAAFLRGFDGGAAKYKEVSTLPKKGDDNSAEANIFCLKR